jgi:Ferritin-like domain
MECSEHELRQMAGDADERHHEAMRTFEDEMSEVHRTVSSAARRVLGGAALGGTALAAGAALGPRRFLDRADAVASTDQGLAAFAQSIELAAVAAYAAAAPALSAATKPVALLFQHHHQEHAAAFGSLAGSKAVTGPNEKLVAALQPKLQAVNSEKRALTLAFGLENQAAETYAYGLTVAMSTAAASGMATILPIETEHAAVLGAALGMAVDAIFVNGPFENAAVGDGSTITQGIDPAKYPVS